MRGNFFSLPILVQHKAKHDLYAYQCFILIHSKYFTSTQMDK